MSGRCGGDKGHPSSLGNVWYGVLVYVLSELNGWLSRLDIALVPIWNVVWNKRYGFQQQLATSNGAKLPTSVVWMQRAVSQVQNSSISVQDYTSPPTPCDHPPLTHFVRSPTSSLASLPNMGRAPFSPAATLSLAASTICSLSMAS